MIKSIQRLKQFGIFANHTNSTTKEFGKYNLFYGWNGSGKSTLSSLFRCIENRNPSSKFPNADILVNIDGGTAITSQNIGSSSLNIYTFNHEFVEENISWNSIVKSILLVDKEKISDLEKLENLKKTQTKEAEIYQKETQAIQGLENEISKFGTDSARHMKTSLQSIDTSDNYYLNYNKTKFEQFIAENSAVTKSDEALLNDQSIIDLTQAARPDKKPSIAFDQRELNGDLLAKARERLDDLLKTSVVSKTIQRLVENPDIKSWVETGLSLHTQHSSTTCEFCENPISAERIKQLESHFNDDYKAFQNRLIKADEWLSGHYIQQILLPPDSELYDEFRKEYAESRSQLDKATLSLNEEIAIWHEILKRKTSNPLDTGLTAQPITELSILEFNAAISSIKSVIEKHNHKSLNFEEETKRAKRRLELHYATTEIKSFEYHQKKEGVVKRSSENSKLKATIESRRSEIRSLEDSLSNETLGADQFNEALHKFIGRSELTLRFNPSKKGYEIVRDNSEIVDGKLSEGERTAIAFVYFMTKLRENDNKMEETIVVVDDPVSSFDSNHIFHAYSFLRNNCANVKQLFVLTHNFTYFKLIRDWFDGVNRNRSRKSPPKPQNAFFYTIEASISSPRNSTIKDADPSLVNYNSEYHYIFSKLNKYRNNQSLSRDEAFLTANLARKLLESFFSFKFPKHRSDISQLMDCGLAGCKTIDETKKEKIYRFINKYSHSIVIEINEDSSENLAGESHNVIGDIFKWLEEVDKVHYDEMLEVVT